MSLYVGCQQKVWPRFRVDCPTSNDPVKKILHRHAQILGFHLTRGSLVDNQGQPPLETLFLEGFVQSEFAVTAHPAFFKDATFTGLAAKELLGQQARSVILPVLESHCTSLLIASL